MDAAHAAGAAGASWRSARAWVSLAPAAAATRGRSVRHEEVRHMSARVEAVLRRVGQSRAAMAGAMAGSGAGESAGAALGAGGRPPRAAGGEMSAGGVADTGSAGAAGGVGAGGSVGAGRSAPEQIRL